MKLPQSFIDALVKLIPSLKWLSEHPEVLVPAIEPPKPVPPKLNTMLTLFCLAIRNFEGWGVPGSRIDGVYYPNGTRSYKNNNPGNCRYFSGGYHSMYGKVGKDKDGFAIFKDYDTGFLYLQNMVKQKARNHPLWNIYDFFQNYAPKEDHNDPRRYASFVASRLGVTIDYPMAKIIKNV